MHLRRRGKKWAVVVYLGRDEKTGKKRYKWYTHETRREAEAHMAQLMHQLQVGGGVTSNKVKLGKYLERWIEDVAAGRVRPSTLPSYAQIVRGHIIPSIGHIPLLRLSAPAVQGYLTRKLGELSPSTVLKHFRVLHRALEDAVRYGIIPRNPCDFVDPLPAQRRELRVWDEEQARLFLAEAKRTSPYYPLYLTALLTGMRQGELLGLRWCDVDLLSGVAHIQQTLYRRGAKIMVGPPKTRGGRRTVLLPPVVVEELFRVRERQAEHRRILGSAYHDHGLVFCQANGKPLHAHNIVRRDFRRVIERAGVPRIRFHDLRHCHATLLLRQGVHPKVVQERLGHSEIRVTLDTYSHVLPALQEEASRKIEGILRPGLY